MNSYLDGQLISSFVHDLCAFLMFPNQISADGVQYYGLMGGKKTYLTYNEFNPEYPQIEIQIRPRPQSLFAVLYLDPKHELNEIASKLIDALEKQTANYWFSDVLISGKNKIMCLHNYTKTFSKHFISKRSVKYNHSIDNSLNRKWFVTNL